MKEGTEKDKKNEKDTKLEAAVLRIPCIARKEMEESPG